MMKCVGPGWPMVHCALLCWYNVCVCFVVYSIYCIMRVLHQHHYSDHGTNINTKLILVNVFILLGNTYSKKYT